MKVEYLKAGSPDCPLIRLFEFDAKEANGLRLACVSLSRGEETAVDLLRSLGVESVGGCRLTFRVGPQDEGLKRATGEQSFECSLTPEGWEDLALLIEPFTKSCKGYQWLTQTGEARLLFSPFGTW